MPEWFNKGTVRYSEERHDLLHYCKPFRAHPRTQHGPFVDGVTASIGYFFTSAATLVTLKRDGDGTKFLKTMAITGVVFSVIFMILQLIPIPGLNGVHFGKESYIMLVIWIAIGLVFYAMQRKFFTTEE